MNNNDKKQIIGHGKCGVAVIRVSGSHSGNILKALTGLKELPKPRMALLKKIYNPLNKDILDKGLIIWFPGPNSFTGEDCCEFQVHGGIAVISSVINAMNSVPVPIPGPNIRAAEAGEFTRRSFHNGKMDLIEVEGLADLLQAETELQRKQALLQTNGVVSNMYNEWRSLLIKCVANIEAYIDFQETDLFHENTNTHDSLTFREISKKVNYLHEEIKKHLSSACKGELLRNGIKTVIVGAPNVGKKIGCEKYNFVGKRPAAIVTPIAGTTRDLLQVTLDINGYPVVLLDTAGLRKTTCDVIEMEGMQRALESLSTADFLILLLDANEFLQWKQRNQGKEEHTNIHEIFLAYIRQYVQAIGLTSFYNTIVDTSKCLIVFNKCDLVDMNYMYKQIIDRNTKTLNNTVVFASCTLDNGLESLLKELTGHFQQMCGTTAAEHPCMTTERHRHLLSKCASQLKLYISISNQEKIDVVILAQCLRSALRQFAKLTGRITTEQILNVIFQDFCIGK